MWFKNRIETNFSCTRPGTSVWLLPIFFLFPWLFIVFCSCCFFLGGGIFFHDKTCTRWSGFVVVSLKLMVRGCVYILTTFRVKILRKTLLHNLNNRTLTLRILQLKMTCITPASFLVVHRPLIRKWAFSYCEGVGIKLFISGIVQKCTHPLALFKIICACDWFSDKVWIGVLYICSCVSGNQYRHAHIDYLISRYKCRKMESHYIRTLACRIKIGLGRGGMFLCVRGKEEGMQIIRT